MENLRKIWNDTCLAAGIPALSFDLCARIMAVLYVLGNDERMVYTPNFVSDIEYARKRYGLTGGETPDAYFVEAFKEYASELEGSEEIPEWAYVMMERRYGIKVRK